MPFFPITPKLDPVIPEHKLRERKYFRYGVIQAAKGAEVVVPDEWINPFALQYLRRMRKNQGNIGQCCGGLAYGEELLDAFMLLKDLPTEEDFAKIQRNLTVKEDGWRCTLTFDRLPPQARSMRFACQAGREEEWPRPQDRPPEGGTVDGTVKAACKAGSVLESLYVTPKSFTCCPEFYTQQINPATGQRWTEAEIREEARNHRWEGYAITGDEIDEIARAIYTSFVNGTGGCGFVGVNIMGDYQNLKEITVAGYTVHIFPGKSGDNLGGHFQTIVGFSRSKGILVTLATWGDDDKEWPFLNGWDADYHRAHAGPVFVPLDTQETEIGRATFSTTLISANVPCQYTVNGQLYVEPPKVSLQDGVAVRIQAIPVSPDAVEPVPTVTLNGHTFPAGSDGSLTFTPGKSMEQPGPDGKPAISIGFIFTLKPEPTPTPPPSPNPFDILLIALKWILSILHLYRPTPKQRAALREAINRLSWALEE